MTLSASWSQPAGDKCPAHRRPRTRLDNSLRWTVGIETHGRERARRIVALPRPVRPRSCPLAPRSGAPQHRSREPCARRGPCRCYVRAVDNESRQTARSHWNQTLRDWDKTRRVYWYDHPQVLRFYRDLIVPVDAPLNQKPIFCFLWQRHPGRRFERGISIGCGTAGKEITLLRDGVVGHFDLYEVSDVAADQGKVNAEKSGVAERIQYFLSDALGPQGPQDNMYDLVHWDNSLHHMSSADAAVALSKRILRPGGLFVMDDYVGPTRFQIPDDIYATALEMRSRLPERYHVNNTADKDRFPLIPRPPRIPVEKMIASDPSEMADSADILPAIARHMPEAQVINTGGIAYVLALRPLFGNFDENSPEDSALLREFLEEDVRYTKEHPENTFHAFAWWVKPD